MFYKFCTLLVRGFMTLVFGMRVRGNENIPKEGPVLLCCNHKSNWDPLAVGSALCRPTSFMAKAELFKNKLLAAVLRSFYVFPVDRKKEDAGAVRSALRCFKEDRMVLIFPQGKRELRGGKEIRARSGVIRIAALAKVSIVPVGIGGRYIPFGGLFVNIGKPVSYEEYHGKHLEAEEYQRLADELMQEIRRLAKEK